MAAKSLLFITATTAILFAALDMTFAICPISHSWTTWYDRDDPSGRADYEILSNLRSENPGQICSSPIDIQARLVRSKVLYTSNLANIVFHRAVGFACYNSGSHRCRDYEVRFCCPRRVFPRCRGVYSWTTWYDRDNPSGYADYEALPILRAENPGKICRRPQNLHVRTVRSKQTFFFGNQPGFVYNTVAGFACWNTNQRCTDYEVRFCCRR